ncbi:MAG TPA: HAD family phosphatase [Terriglobales bacterium]|nr:HAD family phosphatase [Terriglobales bacterium]
MPAITTIFWDVGGVLLSNAWDHNERGEILQRFGVDEAEFQSRHELVVSSFERGKISLKEYLDSTVFCQPRSFSREEFQQAMFSASKPKPEALSLARKLAGTRRYLMGTINNESRELNDYRIQTFGLREIFSLFVSSCFVDLRKPEEKIYRLALDLTQKAAAECCFVDDRPLNLESAARLGMSTIRMQSAAQLQSDLAKLGVAI